MRTVAATAVATSLHRRRFLPENARVHPTALLYGERSLYDDDAVRLIAAGSKSRARGRARCELTYVRRCLRLVALSARRITAGRLCCGGGGGNGGQGRRKAAAPPLYECGMRAVRSSVASRSSTTSSIIPVSVCVVAAAAAAASRYRRWPLAVRISSVLIVARCRILPAYPHAVTSVARGRNTFETFSKQSGSS